MKTLKHNFGKQFLMGYRTYSTCGAASPSVTAASVVAAVVLLFLFPRELHQKKDHLMKTLKHNFGKTFRIVYRTYSTCGAASPSVTAASVVAAVVLLFLFPRELNAQKRSFNEDA
jgi:uncharacterized protein (DUF924 family)